MRAVHVPRSGAGSTLAELPTPAPGPHEVLLRVRAAALNPLDNHIAAGALEQLMEHRYPVVLGRDASGVVEGIGEGVTGVALGDEVVAHVSFAPPFQAGTLAEHAIVPAATVVPKPAELDHVTAAAVPLAAGAAQVAVDAVDPRAGDVVLVNGAAGGVGRFVVQMLAQRGVTVVAVSSPAGTARLIELGATEVVDRTSGPVVDQVRASHPDGVDALINLAGHVLEDVPLGAVKPGGTVRTATQTPDDDTLAARGLSGGGIIASPTSAELAPLLRQVAQGRLAVDIAQVLSLTQAQAGLAELAAGHSGGKIVVDLDR